MKKRKTLTRLLCTAVSVATVAAAGGMALADETDAVEIEEPAEIVEEQPEAEEATEEVDVIADETEAAEAPEEVTEEDALEAEEIIEEVEVTEDEIIVEVIDEEDALEADVVAADEEVIVVEEEAIIFEEAEGKTGWEKHSDGKWYYYKDGSMYYGWLTLGGKTYYLDETYGYLHLGPARISNKYFIFGIDGAMLTGWVNYEDNWYYCTANGAETGWTKIGKNWYYFNPSIENYNGPYMYYNTTIATDGYVYIVDDNGVMQTGWYKRNSSDGSKWFYCDSKGHLLSGWQKIDGKWYYFQESYWYMYAEGFYWIYNKQTSKTELYFFDENGVMQTGWINLGDYWYYFKSNGVGAEGWQKLGGKWYYFEDAEACTGVMRIEGECYYFGLPYKADGSANPNVGVMATGWVSYDVQVGYGTYETRWFYFKANGVRVTGWQKIGGKWYYFRDNGDIESGGSMVTGYFSLYDEGKGMTVYYFFNSNGIMQTNHWEKLYNRLWVYFGSDGQRVSKWQQINGKWYYFQPYMYVGLRYIGGELYDFGTDGVCVNPPELS